MKTHVWIRGSVANCLEPAVRNRSNEGHEVGLRRLTMIDTGTDPAVRNRSNERHEVGLRRLMMVDTGTDPAVGGELRSLGSNERHEVGPRRLDLELFQIKKGATVG